MKYQMTQIIKIKIEFELDLRTSVVILIDCFKPSDVIVSIY